MSTTDSSTPYCESTLKPWRLWLLHALTAVLCLFAALPFSQAQTLTEASNLRVEQAADGLYLSTTVRFELPAALEEALLKGIPMTFVAEAWVLRDRWYWYDKPVAAANRSVRLSYQPLTRRWRLSVGAGAGEFSSGASLSQSFGQLPDAMAAVRRISRWKIAEATEIDTTSRHSIDFNFRLDTTQLPRPMQIGISGNADWNIAVQRNVRPEPR